MGAPLESVVGTVPDNHIQKPVAPSFRINSRLRGIGNITGLQREIIVPFEIQGYFSPEKGDVPECAGCGAVLISLPGP